MSPYWPSLFGGMLIGAAAALLLLVNGRIAGVSGVFGRFLEGREVPVNAAFLLGLLGGPLLYRAAFGALPAVTIVASWPAILIAGLLVGFGTRMGSGCTSGHGVLGLARLSKRSIAATLTFLIAGVVVATAAGAFR